MQHNDYLEVDMSWKLVANRAFSSGILTLVAQRTSEFLKLSGHYLKFGLQRKDCRCPCLTDGIIEGSCYFTLNMARVEVH